MLDLLGCGVDLLLPLLGATAKPQHEVEGRLFLDIVVRQSPAVFELLPGKDQALLVGRNAFLVWNRVLEVMLWDRRRVGIRALDLGLDIVDRVG